MQDLVSIVVPIYNVEAYLDRCIKSIVGQTYENLEILLIDDGSPDNCPRICDEWAKKDSRIRVIHKQNQGLGMARNTGIDNATGRYIMFIDSDDYIDLETVEKCVKAIDGADIVVYSYTMIFPDGVQKVHHISDSKIRFDGQEVIEEFLPNAFVYKDGLSISAWDKMFNLEVMKKYNVRFRSEREVLSEDAYFMLEYMPYVSSISVLPENLYYYYQNYASLSKKYDAIYQKRNDDFLFRSLALCEKLGYSDEVKDSVRIFYHGNTIANMKKIVRSSLSKVQKRKEFKDIFFDAVLLQSLTPSVLEKSKRSLRVFWTLFKLRIYPVCWFLIRCKAKR